MLGVNPEEERPQTVEEDLLEEEIRDLIEGLHKLKHEWEELTGSPW